MNAHPHKLILASAGTGKTFQLTNRFLGLLFDGVEPDRILAATFTRKAAGEILDRILERLVDAAEDDSKCRDLATALGRNELGREDCRKLLARLTRDIDSFRVRTIDAFFLSLVRLFALDLGLPPNWRVGGVREDNRLRSDALQDALADSSTGEMLELLRALKQGGTTRAVHRSMLDQTATLRPVYLESTTDAWAFLQPSADPSDADFDAAIAALATTTLPVTKAGTLNKSFQKGWNQVGELVEAGDWKALLKGGPVGKVLNNEDTYSRCDLTGDYREVLEPIGQRASHRLMAELVARNKASHSLMERFEEFYGNRKHQSGAYQFDDLPLALAPRSARARPLDERELDMWFRMDGRIDHLLLDEFQDTSPIQWRILQHIAREIVADGTGERSFFCVGDVKQSIYGFRNAEPRLLAELANMLPGLESEHMNESYRSSRVVLETVNTVFEDIAGNAAFGPDSLKGYLDAAHSWQAGFHTHKPNAERPGAALVFEAEPKPAEGDKFEPLLELIVQRVEALTAEAPQAEIGILMRVRKYIPTLILRLKRRGIVASGEGGNELVDSSAVQCFVSLLHLADHPSDSAAAFHLAHSPLGEYVGLEPEASAERRAAFARDFRRRIMETGLGAVTSELADRVAADERWFDWDKTRFAQLTSQAFAFERESGLRASDFVDHLRKDRVPVPGGARVRVMTIHASKGLEFDCVILPDLDRNFVERRDRPMVDRPQVDGLIERVSVSTSRELLVLSEDLAQLYHQATKRMVEDSLSSLYVAMTRAARRLELLVPNRGERGNGDVPSIADFVLAALPADQILDTNANGPIWAHAKNAAGGGWARTTDAAAGEELAGDTSDPGLGLAATTALRSLPRRSPSGEEGGDTVPASRLLAPRAGSRRGSLIHAWLEALEWHEDFVLDRERLLAEGAWLEPELARREAALDELERALAQPEIRAALSRGTGRVSAGESVTVGNEVRFALILSAEDGSGRDPAAPDPLWTGSIDRLVLTRRGDEVVRACVIDYKTDRVSESDLADRVEFYRPQLESYARVVAAQTGLAAKAVTKRLLFLSPGRTMDLE